MNCRATLKCTARLKGFKKPVFKGVPRVALPNVSDSGGKKRTATLVFITSINGISESPSW
jgi:hypothetical protein